MENIIEELKEEWIGEEVELLEFDKNMQTVAVNTGLVYNDIFESNSKENINEGSFCFLDNYDENMDWIESINIVFDVVEKTEDILETVIKITNIDLV